MRRRATGGGIRGGATTRGDTGSGSRGRGFGARGASRREVEGRIARVTEGKSVCHGVGAGKVNRNLNGKVPVG